MGVVEVIRSQSLADIVFTADQRRGLVPFDRERMLLLVERFAFADSLMHQAGERMFWLYQKGTYKPSESRRLAIHLVQGNENELAATVEGTSEDALDVLREVWVALGELSEEPAVDLNESLGTFAFTTTMQVTLPKTYKELFPGLDVLIRHTRDGLGQDVLEPPGAQLFQVSARTSYAVGSLTVQRATVIEPRFTSKVDDRVYFTQSPLRSDRHLAMLEALCAGA
jgi:hypothetical protein